MISGVPVPQTTCSLAPSILLNCTLTFATFLRVALDPIGRLAVVMAFLEPHLRDSTDDRTVVTVDSAPETELVRRRVTASDDRNLRRKRGLRDGAGYRVSAARVWAILQFWSVRDIMSSE